MPRTAPGTGEAGALLEAVVRTPGLRGPARRGGLRAARSRTSPTRGSGGEAELPSRRAQLSTGRVRPTALRPPGVQQKNATSRNSAKRRYLYCAHSPLDPPTIKPMICAIAEKARVMAYFIAMLPCPSLSAGPCPRSRLACGNGNNADKDRLAANDGRAWRCGADFTRP